jgi:hypothetical protein
MDLSFSPLGSIVSLLQHLWMPLSTHNVPFIAVLTLRRSRADKPIAQFVENYV